MQLGDLLEQIADGPVPEVDYQRMTRVGARRRLAMRGVKGSALLVVAALAISVLPRDARPQIDAVTPIERSSPPVVPSPADEPEAPPGGSSPAPTLDAPAVEDPAPPGAPVGTVPTAPQGQTLVPQLGGSWLWSGKGAIGTDSSVRVAAVGGDQRVLASDGRGARFSPDGRLVAFVDDQGLNVVAVDGTGLRRLDDLGAEAVLGITVNGLTWSPDGTRIAYHVTPCQSACPTRSRPGIWVVDALADDPAPLRLDPSGADPSWSPTSSELAYWDGFELMAIRIDGRDRRQIWDQGGDTPTFVPRWPAWSPDGKHVAVVVGPEGYSPNARMTTGVRLIDVGTGTLVAALEGPDGFMFREGGPAWSPDGSRLAWSAFTDDSGENPAVFVTDAFLGGMRIVGFGGTPRWSPDGAWIVAATAGEEEIPQLRAFEVDGDRIIATAHHGWDPDWGP